MLEVRPAPFCVLDEVDAALDEANVAVHRGAPRARRADQFIVITHNRGTIEAADACTGSRSATIGQPRDQPPSRGGEGHRRSPPSEARSVLAGGTG